MRERPNRNEQTCRTPAVGDDLYLLFDVLRSGQPDLPAVCRSSGRFRDHTGGHRLHRLRGRPADSRRAGGHLRRWLRQTRRPGLPQIRPVPRLGDHAHHRPLLCDSAYGDHLVRNDGGAFRARPPTAGWPNSSTRSCSSHWRSCSPSIPKNSPKCSADSWDRCCWC